MENNIESYDDILWNKYDHLQKRLGEKYLYYQSSIKYFRDVCNEIENHKINLELINNDVKLNKPTKLDEIFNIFKEFMKLFLENHKKLINKIINNLQKFVTGIKKENPIYNDFKQCFHNYKIEQRKFNQIKEKFHESALEAETKTLKKVQKKNEKKTNELVDLPKKLKKEVGTNLKKYQTSLTEINKKREEYNSKQTDLIKYYVDIEKKELTMYYSVLNDFLKTEIEKTIKFFYQDKINKLSEKNKLKDIDKELEETLKKLKSNEKKDEKLSFEYKSNIDFDKCLENEDFNAYIETVDIIKKNFNNIYEGITLEKEKLKNNVRELIKKFFEIDKTVKLYQIKAEDEELYFNSLKDPSTHPTFIKIMTKLRTNSKFNRQNKLIEILGKSFKIILDEGEKNNSYWAAKNCMILSQTFYYEDEDENKNKIKKYAFEYIKKDSWLTKKDFWIGYDFWIVEEELQKFGKLFPDSNLEDIKNNKNFSPKINNKISDIIFSQLLPSITNMLEITKNNMLAVEIIELFHKKYNYLTEEKIQCLFQQITNNKDDIENMRKEYKKYLNKTNIINNEENINIIKNDKEINNIKANNKEENNKAINDKEEIFNIINNKENNEIESEKDSKDFNNINKNDINNKKDETNTKIDNIINSNEKILDINNSQKNKENEVNKEKELQNCIDKNIVNNQENIRNSEIMNDKKDENKKFIDDNIENNNINENEEKEKNNILISKNEIKEIEEYEKTKELINDEKKEKEKI